MNVLNPVKWDVKMDPSNLRISYSNKIISLWVGFALCFEDTFSIDQIKVFLHKFLLAFLITIITLPVLPGIMN